MKKTISKKQNFSSFTYEESLQKLQVENLIPWNFPSTGIVPSKFFEERLERLHKSFDLHKFEESKKLLIDAICEEAINPFDQLKIWKGATIEGEETTGIADYLIAENIAYLRTPLLCVVEAKKDNFEQGLAQCLVEMQACQWVNAQANKTIDIMGVVSNGHGWQTYCLTKDNRVYEGYFRGIANIDQILGDLHYVFSLSVHHLSNSLLQSL